jgi:hypothetical protein
MPLISDADYDAMLTAAGGGDTVTLGANTVFCMIGAGDVEGLLDAATRKAWGTPMSVTTGALLLTVRTGALPGLFSGAAVTIRSLPYTVDQVLRTRNDSLTHFLAYPKT